MRILYYIVLYVWMSVVDVCIVILNTNKSPRIFIDDFILTLLLLKCIWMEWSGVESWESKCGCVCVRGGRLRTETNRNDPYYFNHINLIWSEWVNEYVLVHYIHLPPTELFIVFLDVDCRLDFSLSLPLFSTQKLLNELSPDRVETQSQIRLIGKPTYTYISL